MKSKLPSLAFAFLTAIISGISIFVNKFAVGIIQPPVTFTFSKNILAGLILIAIIIFSKKYRLLSRYTFKNFLQLFLVGLIGGSIPFYLYFTGLQQTSAINAAIIHKTLALWIILYTLIIRKEKLHPMIYISFATIISANFIVGGFSGFKFNTAEIMILAATILWSVENIISKNILNHIDPTILAASRLFIGSIILFPFTSPAKTPQSFTPTHIAIYLSTVIFLVLYNLSWYHALKRLSVSTASVILTLSTLITNVLSSVFITHNFSSLANFQTTLFLAGALLLITHYLKENQSKDLNTSSVQNSNL